MAPARSLYTGALFTKSLAYAEKFCNHFVILSALHHVVEPDTPIDPYEKTLNNMGRFERAMWADIVIQQLEERYPASDWVYVYLTGENYLHGLPKGGVPMRGMPIGRRLAWLNSQIK